MANLEGYVELDRRFRRLGNHRTQEELALGSYVSRPFISNSSIGWDELIKNRLVVVLGEPGSGKSWELRNQCERLKNAGQFAFFLPLERLVSELPLQIFSPEEQEQFQTWNKSTQLGHFFLDSVDEAKLRKQSDFHIAVQRLRASLGNEIIQRSKLIISSRISEWRPETDRTAILFQFGKRKEKVEESNAEIAVSEADSDDGLCVYQIEPLSREQVLKFAFGRRLAHVEAFASALDTPYAWEFAGRPLDVLDLIEFWSQHGKIGSLTEIIENDITSKLKESSSRLTTDLLSELDARAGAEALAAATVLCKAQTFKIPDDSHLDPEGLNALECLPPDWCMNRTNALLNRAIFDSASYGRVRFHHRRVAERLAAGWIGQRMIEGCPITELDELLFENRSGVRVLRPSLAPVAAWLCQRPETWGEQVRSWVLKTAPEIHLEHGDPASLPLEYRRSILKEFVARYRDRDRVWIDTTHDSLARLADPALAVDIARFISDKSVSVDIREELLQVARLGRLQDCLNGALNIIFDTAEPNQLKGYGVALIRDIGSPESKRKLWSTVQTMSDVPARLCELVCEALYPSTIDGVSFANLVTNAIGVEDRDLEFTWSIKRQIEENSPAHECGAILAAMIARAKNDPHIEFETAEAPISDRYSWVLEIIPVILLKLFGLPELNENETSSSVEALFLLEFAERVYPVRNEMLAEVSKATLKHSNVRREYFWNAARRWRAEYPKHEPYLFSVLGHYAMMRIVAEDFSWLMTDIRQKSDPTDRELAVKVALQIWRTFRLGRSQFREIYNAVASEPSLRDIVRRFKRDLRRAPLQRFRIWLCDNQSRRYRWLNRYGAAKHRLDRLRTRLRLYRNLKRLRSGDEPGWLANLCRDANTDHQHWGIINQDGLREKWGNLITAAVVTGCKVSWRKHVPELPHEKPVANQTDVSVIVGLAGLRALIDDRELIIENMNVDEAQLATRYAVNELNGFPAWLAPLAACRSESVQRVLSDCVRGEWKYAQERQNPFDVLADLDWEGGPLAKLAMPSVMEQVRTGDSLNDSILEYGLSLLLKVGPESNRELAAIALARCESLPIDSVALPVWCATSLQFDAEKTLEVFKRRMNSPNAGEIAITTFGLLKGERRERLPIINRADFLRPSALRRLIPIVYKFVNPKDDIDRAGCGAYSPTDRDAAQDFRNSLLTRLSQSNDRDASEALRELLSEPTLSGHRDWIQHLLDQRIKIDADIPPWTPRDVRMFTTDHEIDPKTDHDLYRIIRKRLFEIKFDVEKSDNSLREEVQHANQEAGLRRWVKRKLEERARGRYTVPQESEIDQEQRPDLRIENPNTAPVSIEIKWADNFTLPVLVERLENQLVGQYLRAYDSRYGIYLVSNSGTQHRWKALDGIGYLDFDAVIANLDARARQLTKDRGDIDEVSVVGIDFRDPAGD